MKCSDIYSGMQLECVHPKRGFFTEGKRYEVGLNYLGHFIYDDCGFPHNAYTFVEHFKAVEDEKVVFNEDGECGSIIEEPKMHLNEYNELKIKELQNEIIGLQAIVKSYQQQLEQTIEYRSVERYREIIKHNNQ